MKLSEINMKKTISTKTNVLEPKKKTFIEALKKSFGVITKACEIVGIDRSTYYKWLQNDELFKFEVENIDEYVLDFVESKLLANINSGNTAEILFYLKTKGKKRGYIERQEVETTIKNGLNIQVNSPIIAEDINKLNEII
jgi:hypothetical protein